MISQALRSEDKSSSELEEVTEVLEYQPGKLFVNRYVRPKYVKEPARTEWRLP